MTITIKGEGHRAEIEIPDGSDIHQAIDTMCYLLMAWSFHPESVKNGILLKAEEYENDESGKEKVG